eukprot:COSAG02_NODE_13627_length_1370_cov_1.641227_2_plen_37_part_00
MRAVGTGTGTGMGMGTGMRAAPAMHMRRPTGRLIPP